MIDSHTLHPGVTASTTPPQRITRRAVADRFSPEQIQAIDAFTSVGAGLAVAAWENAEPAARRRVLLA